MKDDRLWASGAEFVCLFLPEACGERLVSQRNGAIDDLLLRENVSVPNLRSGISSPSLWVSSWEANKRG